MDHFRFLSFYHNYQSKKCFDCFQFKVYFFSFWSNPSVAWQRARSSDCELSGGAGEKQSDVLYCGSITRNYDSPHTHLDFFLSYHNLENHLKPHWMIYQERHKCNKPDITTQKSSEPVLVRAKHNKCKNIFLSGSRKSELSSILDDVCILCHSHPKQFKRRGAAE